MKKFLCVFLVLMLCSVGALASTNPSKEAGDMSDIEITVDDPAGLEGAVIRIVLLDKEFDPVPTAEELRELYKEFTNIADPSNKERLAIAQIELDKLATFDAVEDYFGDVINPENQPTTIREELDCTDPAAVKLEVFEFMPVIAEGFGEGGFGNVKVDMLFTTPYEPGEKVAVMIGLVDITVDETTGEKTQTVEWKVYEGTGADQVEVNDVAYGSIHTEFTEETVLDIQDGIALLAIVSMEEVAAE